MPARPDALEAHHPKVAAILLAAGASSRFGQPKQLVRLDDETLVHRAARAALEAGCAPVMAVVGDAAEKIQTALADLDVSLVVNVEWRDGLGSSIRRGLQDVSTSAADSVILLASDQPLLGADFLKRMIATRLTSGKPIVASAYGGTVGIPALFDRSAFPDLLKLEGDRGAKQLILSRRSDVAEIPFPGGEVDIDTPADYERLTSVSSRGSADAEGPPSRSDDNVPRNT